MLRAENFGMTLVNVGKAVARIFGQGV